ncbi:MAG: hypothetical protein ACJAR6_000819 [Oleispira sp.]|jgi:hypothetical protein
MADPKYDVYFRGEIVPGADEIVVKAAIAKIFNADDATLKQLFSGKVNTIKKSVDKATAAKYQHAFKKAGAKAVITVAKVDSGSSISESKTMAAQVSRAPSSVSQKADVNWDVLPIGSDLLTSVERRNIPDTDIDTSAIKMLSPFFETENEERNVPLAPDTRHLSIAAAGEDMNPNRAEPLPDLELDLSGFSVAEVGANLTDKKKKKIPPAPDTNHIKLV